MTFLCISSIFLQKPASFFHIAGKFKLVYCLHAKERNILNQPSICIFWCQSRKNAQFLRLLKTSNIFLSTKAKFLLKLIHGYKFYFTTHYFFIYSMQFKTSILLWWLSTTSRVTKLGRFSSITGLKYSCTSKIMAEFQAGLLF